MLALSQDVFQCIPAQLFNYFYTGLVHGSQIVIPFVPMLVWYTYLVRAIMFLIELSVCCVLAEILCLTKQHVATSVIEDCLPRTFYIDSSCKKFW